MKKHIALSLALSALLVGCASPGRHHTYEYRIVHSDRVAEDVQKEINELAKDGWRVRSFGLGDGRKYVILERRRKK
jgi:hypothetical protein